MKLITHTLQISTHNENEMINVSGEVQKLLRESKINTGKITLFVPHTTAAVTINENADPDVKRDMLFGLNKTFPKDKDYNHYEGNSHAHIRSSIIGVDQIILVEQNNMLLGTWQGIYLCEHRNYGGSRNIVITAFGE